MRKKFKRIVPFVLVGVLVSSFVMTNYNKAREAKAAFVVDDIALMVALGITYTGLEYYYANGQWLDENDSPVADNDTQKQLDGLLDRSKKHWDEEVRKKAIAQGLIDEDGNILNNGSGGSSGDNNNDDDNKFPSWDKLKEKVAKSGGNVALAVSSLLPFVALYGYGALEKSGADLADKLIDDGFNVDMDYITSNTVAYAYGKEFQLLNDYGDSVIIYSDSPACIYLDSPNHYPKLCLLKDAVSSLVIFKDGSFYKNSNTTAFYGYVNSYKNIRMYDVRGSLKSYYPTFNNFEDANDYLTNLSLDSSFNPVTIEQDSSLRDAMKENGDYPTSPIHSNVKLPSTDKLKELIKNLKSTADDNNGRQNVVDDFIKDLTTPDDSGGVSPNPTPTPDPSNPDSGGSGGTDTDKSNFTRDLRLVFPFCIPFDLVDCIRLFSSEPETPKIDFPIHFPIVNVDYTFTIDLKDFDGVAKICRSMFLIMFIIGLVFATRPLIRG